MNFKAFFSLTILWGFISFSASAAAVKAVTNSAESSSNAALSTSRTAPGTEFQPSTRTEFQSINREDLLTKTGINEELGEVEGDGGGTQIILDRLAALYTGFEFPRHVSPERGKKLDSLFQQIQTTWKFSTSTSPQVKTGSINIAAVLLYFFTGYPTYPAGRPQREFWNTADSRQSSSQSLSFISDQAQQEVSWAQLYQFDVDVRKTNLNFAQNIFSVIQAYNEVYPAVVESLGVILSLPIVKSNAGSFAGAILKGDSCQWKPKLNSNNIQSLAHTNYGLMSWTSFNFHGDGPDTAIDCMPFPSGSASNLSNAQFRSSLMSDSNAGDPVASINRPNGFLTDANWTDISNGGSGSVYGYMGISGGGGEGGNGPSVRELSLWNAQQTAFHWGQYFIKNFFSKDILTSIGIPQSRRDRFFPANGVAPAQTNIIIQEEWTPTFTSGVNILNGGVYLSVSPYLSVPLPSGKSVYASAAFTHLCGEYATWATQNLITPPSGFPSAYIPGESSFLNDVRTSVASVFLGQGIERFASALCAGLSTKNPDALLSTIAGAQNWGPSIYNLTAGARRLAHGTPYNSEYDVQPFRYHFSQGDPLYTVQGYMEDPAAFNTGRPLMTRDGIMPPLDASQNAESISPMNFGGEAFTNVLMRMANYMGEQRAWRIALKAISTMTGGVSGWNARNFATDLQNATVALYGAAYLPATRAALMLHGFDVDPGVSAFNSMRAWYPTPNVTTFRNQAGIGSSLFSPQPGITFVNPNTPACNYFPDRTPAISSPVGDALRYITVQYSPFSMAGAGDSFEWRQQGTISNNIPNLDGDLIADLTNTPLENHSVFLNSTSKVDYAYKRCLTAGLVDPQSGFNLMNYDLRPIGYTVRSIVPNGFALKQTINTETSSQIRVTFEIADPSNIALSANGWRSYTYEWSMKVSNRPVINSTGTQVTYLFDKNEFFELSVVRKNAGNGIVLGDTKLLMAVNDLSTYILISGHSNQGPVADNLPTRASFLWGRPRGSTYGGSASMFAQVPNSEPINCAYVSISNPSNWLDRCAKN